ncbi:MAG: hypothetical protein WCP72_09655 [Desulfomonile sp.]
MDVPHNLPHWNYYRLLESDLELCFRYVEPVQEHFGVYSDEFAKIIVLASTEIENGLKSLVRSIQSHSKTHQCGNASYAYRNSGGVD